MLYLNRFAFVLQKRIAEIGVGWNPFGNFAKDSAGRPLESEINAQFLRQLRDYQPVRLCLMHWVNRLASTLDEPIVVGKGAINLGERSCGKDDISRGRRSGFKEFLYY